MKTEDRAADLHPLDRAARTFAANLAALRRQHALSLQDMALCTGTPRWRIDQLVTGQTLPAWDEVQGLAWLFKIPLSTLIRSLQRACSGAPRLTPQVAAPRSDARRIWSLQALATAHPEVFDVTLAEWPAHLAPHLAQCLAAEVTILQVSDGLLQDCLIDMSEDCLSENLPGALDALVGVDGRLRALTIRHTLRVNAPHATGMHALALDIDTALSALAHPIHLLRALRNQSFEAPLSSDDRRALTNILNDAIAALKNAASTLHRR